MNNLKRYVIAADMGTTSVKTLLVDRQGTVVHAHSVFYPMSTPSPEIAEQDPDQMADAVLEGIRQLLLESNANADEILCVSFSAAMHSLLAVDDEGAPLTPLITWADNRSAAYAEELKRSGRGKEIYERTGTPIHPMSPLVKLLWLREHEPEVFAKAGKFIGIKEYVFFRLFGSYVVDHSSASATGLLHMHTLTWDSLALSTAGIGEDRLSKPVSASHREVGLPLWAVQRTGLAADTPFVIGAADGPLANLGAGAVVPGSWALTVGTSGAVRTTVSAPLADPMSRLFCYALADGLWTVGGAINNGGILFRWTRDVLATQEAEEGLRRGMDPYDYLTELAHEVPPGSDGLIFLPYLLGERSPYWNSNARGVFFGLSMSHSKNHMIRAVMEGVVYGLHSVAAALEELTGSATEVRASGGFARSPLWRQMLADVLGKSVHVMDSVESSGVGAAYLGLWAMGEVPDLTGIRDWTRVQDSHSPDPATGELYRELTDQFDRLYERLAPEFDVIAQFQAR
ncbi:gluconokinase [Gorillibacterium timonense]|uniref:gluconokinase n=1 Tax=Gorillibacterium timonense TaxID=1689269 RepID=UPI00071C4A7C|nr:FGGY family carbohydrate kinase [Gorillibacterium timonense]